MAAQLITKQPAEKFPLDFDFTKMLRTGDTLPSASGNSVVTAEGGLTLGSKVHTGAKVQQVIEGGVAGRQYRLSCAITTSLGDVHELDADVRVQDTQ